MDPSGEKSVSSLEKSMEKTNLSGKVDPEREKAAAEKMAALEDALRSGDSEKLKPFLIEPPHEETEEEKASAAERKELLARKLNKKDIVEGMREARLQEMLKRLQKTGTLTKHDFWDTQPVPKIDEEVTVTGEPLQVGNVAAVRKTPLPLPSGYEWYQVDIWSDEDMKPIFSLLSENYVEDDDALFRFMYSIEFLRWALSPPGYIADWHIGVRVARTKKPVGFITGIPATAIVRGKSLDLAEINFLCVHKKLRSKRLAPVLIQEVTRHVNLTDRWQAVYTSGTVLPKPLGVGRYYHRNLNPKKLVEVNFTSLSTRMTIPRARKLFKLPNDLQVPGLRQLDVKDIPQCRRLLTNDLAESLFKPSFTEDELKHWLIPRKGVVDAYVVECPETHKITDFVSFYHLPSSVINNKIHDVLNVTYLNYYVASGTPVVKLITDALILAKRVGCDVFNALDIGKNSAFLNELKFGIGDGSLNYYLFNWKCQPFDAGDISLILM